MTVPPDGVGGGAEAVEEGVDDEGGRLEASVRRGSFSFIFIFTASSPYGNDSRANLLTLRGEALCLSLLSALVVFNGPLECRT